MRSVSVTGVTLAISLFFSALNARADPFVILPDGSVAFITSMTTEGTFFCEPFLSAPCSASGNSVTLGTGADTLALTFTGVNSTFLAGNIDVPVTMGEIASSGSPGFRFPSQPNPNQPVFGLTLSVTESSPTAGVRTFTGGFGPGGGTEVTLETDQADYVSFPAGANPPGFHYNNIVYTLSPFPFSLSADTGSVTRIGAEVGAAPEPGTLLFVSTGIVGFMVRRYRRSKYLAEGS